MTDTLEQPAGRSSRGTALTAIGVAIPLIYALAAGAFLIWAALFSEEGGEPASPVALAYAVVVLTGGGLAALGLGAGAIATGRRRNRGRPAGPETSSGGAQCPRHRP